MRSGWRVNARVTSFLSVLGLQLVGLKQMQRLLIAAVAVVLSTQCYAQQNSPDPGQCEQVRSAIEQYGREAARKHAMANYNLSAEDTRRIEQQCGVGGGREKRAKK